MTVLGETGETKGWVFNIQRYSTHDGPGIRTVVFLKGCPLHCFWCQNPESRSVKPVLMFKKDRCTRCGRCIAACPHQANSMVEGEVRIERSRCALCGACVAACLAGARDIQGKIMTVQEIMDVVAKDIAIYDNSGGGITLSGGDCEMQPGFSVALLRAAHEEGINTAVEITGSFAWQTVKMITDHADYVLFDLKVMDEEKHKKGTGVSNALILENARNLVGEKKAILFRTPLIPGFNDGVEDIRAIARFVKYELGLNPAEHVRLLAYNNLGEEKYARMDYQGERPSYQRQSDAYIKELNESLAAV